MTISRSGSSSASAPWRRSASWRVAPRPRAAVRVAAIPVRTACALWKHRVPLYSSRAPRDPPTTDSAWPKASGQRSGARSSRTAVVVAAPITPAVAVEWKTAAWVDPSAVAVPAIAA